MCLHKVTDIPHLHTHKLTILTEPDAQTGYRVRDRACESEGLIQVMVMMMMMVRCHHRRRGEIIQLDLLHQKGAGHDSHAQEALRMDVKEGKNWGKKRLLEQKKKQCSSEG